MAQVIVSRETKAKLLQHAGGGQAIESWMFTFIRYDAQFQAELFQTAETANNWQFLLGLSDFRAQQKKLLSVTKVSYSEKSLGFHKKPIPREKWKPIKLKKPRAKLRQLKRLDLPPFDPTTLPISQIIQIHKSDWTNCPECKRRLLKKVLNDHLDMTCPNRGKSKNRIVSLSEDKPRKSSSGIVFCYCGQRAMQNEIFCYDHKHT